MAKRGFYKWKIPLLPKNKKHLLCTGYSRLNFNRFITTAIIQLFSQYFGTELDDIKNADTKTPFKSDIFTIQTFRFQLLLYPNGCCTLPEHQNQFVVFISFYSVRFKLSKVETAIQLKICEIKQRFSDQHTFQHDDSKYGQFIQSSHRIPFEKIQFIDIQDLNQLTIEFTVDILDVYNKNYCIISDYFKNFLYVSTPSITLPVSTGQWKICDPMIIQEIKNTKDKKEYFSEEYQWSVFKVILCLTINDEDNMSYVRFDVSDFPEDVSIIRFDYTLTVEEIQTDKDSQKNFCMIHKEFEIGTQKSQRTEILTEKFQNVDKITFNFLFGLIDVYDETGNAVKNFVELEVLKGMEIVDLSTEIKQ